MEKESNKGKWNQYPRIDYGLQKHQTHNLFLHFVITSISSSNSSSGGKG